MGRSTALWDGSAWRRGAEGRPHRCYSSWKEVVARWGRPLLPGGSAGMRGDGLRVPGEGRVGCQQTVLLDGVVSTGTGWCGGLGVGLGI